MTGFLRPRVQVELVGGPRDGGAAALPLREMPDGLTLVAPCAGCGAFHPVGGGHYSRVGTPARGYAGQFLWTPGGPR